MTLKERLLGDRSSLTSESESEMCREDLPMRQRPVIMLGVVVLDGGGVKLLPLGTVGDKVGGVAALKASPR
jgi:hypothetical protein